MIEVNKRSEKKLKFLFYRWRIGQKNLLVKSCTVSIGLNMEPGRMPIIGTQL